MKNRSIVFTWATLLLLCMPSSMATPTFVTVTERIARNSKLPIKIMAVEAVDGDLRFSVSVDYTGTGIDYVDTTLVRIWHSDSVISETTAAGIIRASFLVEGGNTHEYRCVILSISEVFGVTTVYELKLDSFLVMAAKKAENK